MWALPCAALARVALAGRNPVAVATSNASGGQQRKMHGISDNRVKRVITQMKYLRMVRRRASVKSGKSRRNARHHEE